MNRALIVTCLLGAVVPRAAAEEPSMALEKTFVVVPARSPTPTFRLRLLASRDEQVPGDGAVFYHRAIESQIGLRYREEAQALKSKLAGDLVAGESSYQSAYDWLTLPSDKFPRDETRILLDRRSTALEEARLGSLRETCDWGFRHRSEGYSLLLGDMQEMRELSRWISLQVRLDAEEGRIAEAIQGLKTGLGLARDVGRSDFLIQSLIAVACADSSLDALEFLVQKPGCPNLYWALAALPTPFVDLAGPTESEVGMLGREISILQKLEPDVWSLDTARVAGDELAARLGRAVDGWPVATSPHSQPMLSDLPARAYQIAAVAKDYARAKEALTDGGVSSAKLDAMPMIQVVALDSYRTYTARYDEYAKWSYLPYWLAARGWKVTESRTTPTSGFPLAEVVPATRSASMATARLQRRIAALQVLEGLRLFADSHQGNLPNRLEDLTETPSPLDPITGKPFEYRLDGDRAVLSSPSPAGFERSPKTAIHYEFRKAR